MLLGGGLFSDFNFLTAKIDTHEIFRSSDFSLGLFC